MRKGLKVLSTSLLLSALFLTGCSCNKDEKPNVSRITNADQALAKKDNTNIEGYTMLDLYETLLAIDSSKESVANKLVEFVATDVLKVNDDTSEWKERYNDLVAKKLEELANSGAYLVGEEFSEELLQYSLNAEGYTVTCASGYGKADNLKCDYTDYINKKIKVEALSTLLKQKYIQDVVLAERENVITSKKIRDVEYFTVSSSLDKEYDDLSVRDFMRDLRDRIADKEVIDFSAVEAEFKEKLEEIVEKEYNKIGKSDDYSQAIASEYTKQYTQSAETGYKQKLETIDNYEYSFEKLISSDSEASSIVSADITSAVLGINDPEDTNYSRRMIKVVDNAGNTYYYLVNSNVGATVDAKDILLSESSDAAQYTYSIVRFRVINSSTQDKNDIHKAVELMARESSLASNAVSHYIKEKKDALSIYDDELKTYLEALYPDVFAE